ncbi:unnamed protein product, partial [Mesorhabditis spiculigera]
MKYVLAAFALVAVPVLGFLEPMPAVGSNEEVADVEAEEAVAEVEEAVEEEVEDVEADAEAAAAVAEEDVEVEAVDVEEAVVAEEAADVVEEVDTEEAEEAAVVADRLLRDTRHLVEAAVMLPQVVVAATPLRWEVVTPLLVEADMPAQLEVDILRLSVVVIRRLLEVVDIPLLLEVAATQLLLEVAGTQLLLEKFCNSVDYYDTMTDKCPSTCQRCPHGGETGSTTIEPVICQDKATDCVAKSQLCNQLQYREMMNRLCRQTCGNCEPGCYDAAAKCPDWNRRGYCSSSKYTTQQKKQMCAKTCALC